jgi:hypothetical protein
MEISIENRLILKWRNAGLKNKTGKTGLASAAFS